MEENPDFDQFIRESNLIEGVYDEESVLLSKAAFLYGVRHSFLGGGLGVPSVTDICHMQYLVVLANMRDEDHYEVGKIRTMTVYIGGRRCSVVGEELYLELQQWVKRARYATRRARSLIRRGKQDQAEKLLLTIHVDFEMIHPFIDGNGRTGRILYNIQRAHIGLELDVIEKANVAAYYALFKEREMMSLLEKTIGIKAPLAKW